uniref:WAP domain-containing protein n=1 Tax=Anolis carolinensis TaxID=28377 RepID=A0A803TJR4_ANOCA
HEKKKKLKPAALVFIEVMYTIYIALPELKHPGYCPKSNPKVSGECRKFCSGDANCPGDMRCCECGCSQKCMLPIEGKA